MFLKIFVGLITQMKPSGDHQLIESRMVWFCRVNHTKFKLRKSFYFILHCLSASIIIMVCLFYILAVTLEIVSDMVGLCANITVSSNILSDHLITWENIFSKTIINYIYPFVHLTSYMHFKIYITIASQL